MISIMCYNIIVPCSDGSQTGKSIDREQVQPCSCIQLQETRKSDCKKQPFANAEHLLFITYPASCV